jgi:predicted flap endonuclease-1-like 5' DNA nuclease
MIDMTAAEFLEAYGLYLLIAFLVGFLTVWLIGRANRKTSVKISKDVLDEDAAPAARNQALIDAPTKSAGVEELPKVAPVAEPVAKTVAEPEPAPEPAPPPAPPPPPPPSPAPPPAPEPAPEPEPEPAPAPPPAPPPAAAAPEAKPATKDNLTQIKGLGPKLAVILNDLGVTSFAQIAAWDNAEIARIDAQLGRFEGRITRDNWVEQAKLLAAGDEEGFASQFGQNG